jgi:hypothetical protein
MLGVDDFLVILAATMLANLAAEVGGEIIAEWWLHTPAPGLEPGEIDPSAQLVDEISPEQLELLNTVLITMQSAG